MKRCAIAKVLVDESDHMYVSPETEAGANYEHIYREANGLRWDRSMRAFHASAPERWKHVELLRHIAATLASAYDEELHFTEKTIWLGIAPEMQLELRSALK